MKKWKKGIIILTATVTLYVFGLVLPQQKAHAFFPAIPVIGAGAYATLALAGAGILYGLGATGKADTLAEHAGNVASKMTQTTKDLFNKSMKWVQGNETINPHLELDMSWTNQDFARNLENTRGIYTSETNMQSDWASRSDGKQTMTAKGYSRYANTKYTYGTDYTVQWDTYPYIPGVEQFKLLGSLYFMGVSTANGYTYLTQTINADYSDNRGGPYWRTDYTGKPYASTNTTSLSTTPTSYRTATDYDKPKYELSPEGALAHLRAGTTTLAISIVNIGMSTPVEYLQDLQDKAKPATTKLTISGDAIAELNPDLTIRDGKAVSKTTGATINAGDLVMPMPETYKDTQGNWKLGTGLKGLDGTFIDTTTGTIDKTVPDTTTPTVPDADLGLWDWLKAMLQGIWDGITGVFTTVKNVLAALGVLSVLTGISDGVKYVVTTLGGIAEWSFDTLLEGIDGIGAGLAKIAGWGLGGIASGIDAIKGFSSTIAGWGLSGLTGAIDGIKTVMGTIAGWGVGAWTGTIDGIGTAVDSIAEFFKDGIVGDPKKIKWERLKMVGTGFTQQFPFSLPWDAYNAFNTFLPSSDVGKPNFDLSIYTPWDKSHFDFTVSIPKELDFMFVFARWSIFALWNVGLIYVIRQWFGGAS